MLTTEAMVHLAAELTGAQADRDPATCPAATR